MKPKCLIACEESQTITKEMRLLGIETFSCDLLPCSGGHPEWHIQCDVLSLLQETTWHLMIAHPPCTYLCVPSARYINRNIDNMEQAKLFFEKLLSAPIDRIAIENPVPHHYAGLPKYDQIIQPWMFGDEYSKRTCLWLKNLPKLIPTDIRENKVERYRRKDGSFGNSKWYANSTPRQRSKTFPGIAKAMAMQWGFPLVV